jgi:hypothetical protein
MDTTDALFLSWRRRLLWCLYFLSHVPINMPSSLSSPRPVPELHFPN